MYLAAAAEGLESLGHSAAASHAASAAAAGVLAVSPSESADALVVQLQALLDMAASTAAPKCWLATVAARLLAIIMVIRLADAWLAQIELLQRRHPAQGRTQPRQVLVEAQDQACEQLQEREFRQRHHTRATRDLQVPQVRQVRDGRGQRDDRGAVPDDQARQLQRRRRRRQQGLDGYIAGQGFQGEPAGSW